MTKMTLLKKISYALGKADATKSKVVNIDTETAKAIIEVLEQTIIKGEI